MKRKGYKEISIKEKTYERLEELKNEFGNEFLYETIEELLNIWEDVDVEEDTTYCVNCGDYHD